MKQKRMAGKKRKVKRFVIDVNTFITIFINQEADWLLQYILKNKIEVFSDSRLITELLRVLDYPRIKKYSRWIKTVCKFCIADQHTYQIRIV
jgi:putative PIN family toxin of toxin-antitoxin system